MDVSIVIPTKNGGALFDEVLTMIDKQETEYEYEVICVDSGSTDDTVDIIKRLNGILSANVSLPPSECRQTDRFQTVIQRILLIYF